MSILVHRPVAGNFKISSKYGKRKDPVTGKESAMHYGTDFAVPVGTPVVAAVGGIIDATDWENEKDHNQGFGRRVRQIASDYEGNRYYVYYAHLSETAVEAGDEVTAGTRVGLSGNTGKSSGPHLHFEVRPIGGKGVEVKFIEG